MENRKKTQDDTDEDRFGHLRGFVHFKAGMLPFCIKVIKGRLHYALLIPLNVLSSNSARRMKQPLARVQQRVFRDST